MNAFVHTSALFSATKLRHRHICPTRIARSASSIPLTCVAEKVTTDPNLELAFKTISETPNPIQVPFTNPIPSYLSNLSYYLNGPAIYEVPHRDGVLWKAKHWFDGIGIVHSFRFNSELSTLLYRSSSNNQPLIETIRATKPKDFIDVTIGRRENSSLVETLRRMRPLTMNPTTASIPYNTVVSLQTIPGKGLLNARTDVNTNQLLDPITLELKHVYSFSDLHPNLDGDISCAHGLTDRNTKEYFNFVSQITGFTADYKVFKIDPTGQTDILASFQDNPCYIHSFALTQNYVIMVLCPSQYDVRKLVTTKSVSSSVVFPADVPTKFVVISRTQAAVVATYEYDQFFTFHVINAFERDDEIVIDLSYYDDPSILQQLHIDYITSGGEIARAKPVRFTLPDLSRMMAIQKPEYARAKKSQLAKVDIELATVSPRCETHSYQYVYGISDNGREEFHGDIVKLDVTSGTAVRWHSPGMLTNEPIFVPDPNGEDEDDGSVLFVTLNVETETSSLVILDAKTMTETTRADLPSRIPLAFHGTILPALSEEEQT